MCLAVRLRASHLAGGVALVVGLVEANAVLRKVIAAKDDRIASQSGSTAWMSMPCS
jgi:hypothetical protein